MDEPIDHQPVLERPHIQLLEFQAAIIVRRGQLHSAQEIAKVGGRVNEAGGPVELLAVVAAKAAEADMDLLVIGRAGPVAKEGRGHVLALTIGLREKEGEEAVSQEANPLFRLVLEKLPVHDAQRVFLINSLLGVLGAVALAVETRTQKEVPGLARHPRKTNGVKQVRAVAAVRQLAAEANQPVEIITVLEVQEVVVAWIAKPLRQGLPDEPAGTHQRDLELAGFELQVNLVVAGRQVRVIPARVIGDCEGAAAVADGLLLGAVALAPLKHQLRRGVGVGFLKLVNYLGCPAVGVVVDSDEAKVLGNELGEIECASPGKGVAVASKSEDEAGTLL